MIEFVGSFNGNKYLQARKGNSTGATKIFFVNKYILLFQKILLEWLYVSNINSYNEKVLFYNFNRLTLLQTL